MNNYYLNAQKKKKKKLTLYYLKCDDNRIYCTRI